MSYEIRVSLRFKKELKSLRKKYKKIDKDLENLKKELLVNPTAGTPLGDNLYKIRLSNSSIPTGKRGGFRIITFVKIEKETIILLTIYAKTEKENISDEELKEILNSLG